MTYGAAALALTAALLAAPAGHAAPDTPAPQRLEQGGLAIEFDVRQVGDGEGAGVAQLTLSDARSGRPVEGARPAAWMVRRHSEAVAGERSCEDKARALVSGSLGDRADIDLNGYRLLTLNHDHTIAFINPLVRLRNTQLESIVQLPGAGHDWTLAGDGRHLAVSLREANAVALVDVVSRRVAATVPTGAGSLPTRLLADPDGRRLWVGLDGAAEVLAIDLATAQVAGRVPVGRGLHTLALAPGQPWLFATHSDSGSVSVIDRATLRRLGEVPVGATPVAAAWSEAAQRLAVLSANGGQLALLDPVALRVGATVPLARGVLALALFDGGRRALVANHSTHKLTLVDLASARVVAERRVAERPDQIALTRDFAYVRSQSTAAVQLIALAAAREGRLEGPAVPMGQRAPAEAPEAINVASVLAAAPEGNGMLVANAGDGSIYRYAQGMMVPVNSHSNYRRRARGLLVLDGSLAERAPGRFEAALRVPRSGRYDVVVRNQQPALTACFTLALEGAPPSPAQQAAAARPRPRLLAARALGEGRLGLEFTLAPAESAAATGPVTVLLVQQRGRWQGRAVATQLAPGRYRVQLDDLPPGDFEALVAAPALELGYAEGRLGRIAWPVKEGSP